MHLTSGDTKRQCVFVWAIPSTVLLGHVYSLEARSPDLRDLQAFLSLRVFPAHKQNPRQPTCGYPLMGTMQPVVGRQIDSQEEGMINESTDKVT